MLFEAIQSISPTGARFRVTGDEITWMSADITQPTEAEIEAEVTRLQAEYDSKQYARDRAEAYPSTVDQLDDIYHNGVDGWKATIKAVKDTYPKETI